MAASKDKAQALKNSYVDGIIDELGGASDPAVRMVIREGDQASVHSFPEAGKAGAINDGDPGLYIHGNGKSYLGDTNPSYANPIEGGAPGSRMLMDAPEDAQQGGEEYLNEMEQRMGGTGDLALLGPRTLEEFNKRNPSNRPPKKRTLRRKQSSSGGFDSSNLAGAMGMEQGNTAGVVMDLQNGIRIRKNDGNPRLVIRDGSRRAVVNHPGSANPISGKGYGASEVDRSPRHIQADAAGLLHSINNRIDTTVYDGSRGADNVGKMYKEQMYQPFTG